MTGVNIPESVTYIGGYAFYGCDGLTSISIPDSVTYIGVYAFYDCSGLTSINIPGSVTGIGQYTFYNCGGLTKISIPNGVTIIGKNAFMYCDGLTSISIPDSVTSIGAMAFKDCDSLTDVYYSGTRDRWDNIEIGESNDSLLGCKIHYNSTGPIIPLEVNPVEPIINAEENTIEIPVTVTEPERAEELNDVELYVAEYDADGRFVGLTLGTKGEIEGDTVVITADIPSAENYKFMLWDGNNVPLMDAVSDIK